MASGNIVNDWSSGLCDCIKDCRSCCLTCWCPCITFGRVAEIVDKGQSSWAIALRSGNNTVLWEARAKIVSSISFAGVVPCAKSTVNFQFQGYDVGAGWEANAARKASGVTMAPVGEKMTR